MAITLTKALREEYQSLFDTCVIRPARQAAVEKLVEAIGANRARYEKVAEPLGTPWYFVGITHNMESSLRFDRHLHNGDPLTARTVQVPAGRPVAGAPPFPWEVSAADALGMKKLDQVKDWTAPGLLFQFERYNGFGYRNSHPEVLSPYLWSFSTHYTKGKFVADGKFDANATSAQCGAAVLLRRFAEKGLIELGGETAPRVVFSKTEKSEAAENLQRALNLMPGIFLKVDGIPGPLTSDAVKKVTGRFLEGDPRG